MTVIPASSLSRAEMWMLGNNVVPRFTKDRRKRSAGCEAPAFARLPASLVPRQPPEERPVRDDGDEVLDGQADLLTQFQEAAALCRRYGHPLGRICGFGVGLRAE